MVTEIQTQRARVFEAVARAGSYLSAATVCYYANKVDASGVIATGLLGMITLDKLGNNLRRERLM